MSTIFCCPDCGCTDIVVLAWVKTNSDKVKTLAADVIVQTEDVHGCPECDDDMLTDPSKGGLTPRLFDEVDSPCEIDLTTKECVKHKLVHPWKLHAYIPPEER